MRPDPVRNDNRRAARRSRLGPDAACALCGETDPVVLHHVAHRSNDAGLVVVRCANCHLRAHERLRGRGIGPDEAEAIRPAVLMAAMAAELGAMATAMDRLAETLEGGN